MIHSDFANDDHYANTGSRDFKPIDFMKSGAADGQDFDYDAFIKESNQRIDASLDNCEVILTPLEQAQVAEIIYLHDTALARALKRDGHSKSSEGAVSINLDNYWQRLDKGEEGEYRRVGLSLYSYVLGTSRSHWFATIERALETMRVWYAQEMSTAAEYDYSGWDDLDNLGDIDEESLFTTLDQKKDNDD